MAIRRKSMKQAFTLLRVPADIKTSFGGRLPMRLADAGYARFDGLRIENPLART